MSFFAINAVVSFVAALVLHEFGHYVAARMCRVPIKQAGFGWGPKIYGVKVSTVDCQLRLLPVGAYVQMDIGALQRRPLLQQLFVLGAGIGVNVVLCVLTWGSLFGVFNLALAIGNLAVYGPLRNVLGMSRIRVAYTAGAAIGPTCSASTARSESI